MRLLEGFQYIPFPARAFAWSWSPRGIKGLAQYLKYYQWLAPPYLRLFSVFFRQGMGQTLRRRRRVLKFIVKPSLQTLLFAENEEVVGVEAYLMFSRLTAAGTISEHGGKGYSLKCMVRNGFNVPPGFVLCSAFYRQNYPRPPRFNYQDNAELEAQCAEMRKNVTSRQLPDEQKRELRLMLAEFDEDARFAVRSSSTLEDLATASFAGQHDTFLNITRNDVAEKIRLCLASLWKPHAVLYRNHHGFDQEEASMAVVIQKMIEGIAAGVVFSVDPVSGDLSHVLVEGNYGIGESVVGGEAVTDTWIVSNKSWEIIERRIKEKEYALVTTTKGIEKKMLCGEEQKRACLHDDQVADIARQACELSALFESPQDIEWVYGPGRLYVLQSRPQTAIPPRFTRDESAERFPDPVTPLTWSYVKEAFDNSLEYSLSLMNIHLATRPWFDMKDHYVYGNQNAVELLALHRPIRAKTFEQLIEEIPRLRKKYQWVMDLPQGWMRDLDTYLIRIGGLAATDFDSYSCADYQEYCTKLFSLANEYFKPNIAISMTQTFLTRTLMWIIQLLTEDEMQASDLFKRIISVSETKTGQINRELFCLSLLVRKNRELQDLLAGGGKAALRSLGQQPEFFRQFMNFLDNYGHREVTFDYYNPTWYEAPEVVLDLIYLTSTAERLHVPHKKERVAKEAQLSATHQLYSQTPAELHFFLHELIRLTLNFTFLDDLEHFQTTRINLLARRAVGCLGVSVQKACNLEDPYDLFFLTKAEFESLATFKLNKELLALIRKRKSQFQEAAQNEPIWDLDEKCEASAIDHERESVLAGVPGSSGECEGEVYLVHGTEDFAGMPEGAVLVAKTTNPAWTPLFYKAKAVITESGGPLSHGAVTARELGMPAVMCVRNCLKILNTGDHVLVNGQKGLVIIS